MCSLNFDVIEIWQYNQKNYARSRPIIEIVCDMEFVGSFFCHDRQLLNSDYWSSFEILWLATDYGLNGRSSIPYSDRDFLFLHHILVHSASCLAFPWGVKRLEYETSEVYDT